MSRKNHDLWYGTVRGVGFGVYRQFQELGSICKLEATIHHKGGRVLCFTYVRERQIVLLPSTPKAIYSIPCRGAILKQESNIVGLQHKLHLGLCKAEGLPVYNTCGFGINSTLWGVSFRAWSSGTISKS